jgi:hypothetical protein
MRLIRLFSPTFGAFLGIFRLTPQTPDAPLPSWPGQTISMAARTQSTVQAGPLRLGKRMHRGCKRGVWGDVVSAQLTHTKPEHCETDAARDWLHPSHLV